MPPSLALPDQSARPRGAGPALCSLFLALAVLAPGNAPAWAQAEAKPQTPPAATGAPNDPVAPPDRDKKLVQDRWGTSTGTPSQADKKSEKPGKRKNPESSGAAQ